MNSILAAATEVGDEALEAHNALRKIHGSDPMEYDEEMAKSAESVAILNAKQGRLEHSKDLSKLGENLAYNCEQGGKLPSIKESVKQW